MSELFPETKVVAISKENFDIYIGRKVSHRFEESTFHNPFKIGYDGDRREVVLLFLEYWYAPERKTLRELAVKELTGKTLGCWCKPLLCHGDIVASYVNWRNNEDKVQLPIR